MPDGVPEDRVPEPRGVAEEALRVARRAGVRPVGATVLSDAARHQVVRVHDAEGADVVVRVGDPAGRDLRIEVAAAARAADVGVPVPPVLACDHTGEAVGRPALVWRHVDGVPADRVLATAAPGEHLAVAAALGRTVATLGRVVLPRPGLFAAPDLSVADDQPVGSEVVVPFVEAGLATVTTAELTPAEQVRWHGLAAAAVAEVATVDAEAVLVHADCNPKNVLLHREGDGWAVAALLDWEFAMAGSALIDLGNLQRFAHRHPPGWVDAVARGFREAGGALPDGWRRIAAGLDAIALGDLLARRSRRMRADVLDVVRRAVAADTLVPDHR